MKPNLPAVISAGLLALTANLSAQSFSIDWHTIDGGGGASAGGGFSVNGTIGQPDAGASLAGGGFALTGGFWSAVPTLGAPLLTIRRTPTNSVVISWPSPSTDFTLQQNANLNTASWTAPAEAISDNGTNRFIIVNPPTGNRFYRLIGP